MDPPVKPVWYVGIVVPARNEEDTIVECIDSIRRASEAARGAFHCWTVVAADHCLDRTAARARQTLGTQGEVIECDVRSAGAARRAGCEAALAHFRTVAHDRLWLANTDADTCVPIDWLTVQLAAADQGAAAVAGIVRLDEYAVHETQAREAFRATYLTQLDTHTHVHGANLGFRADAYLAAGGWSRMALAEDHCLWRRLRQNGWRVISPTNSVVTTSGRLEGRAAGGFADTLNRLLDAPAAL
jgi:cellulose synthase/poly-beta-1,6-N-acetylglucosamine synthase-like glycosyltransferase